MAKIDTALYGISANPITLGHELVARAVYAQCLDIDDVWFSACYHHQFGKEIAPPDFRLRMCQAVAKSMGCGGVFHAWDWEMEKKFKGTTWDFANLAEHQFPDRRFHFVIGMDNAQTLLSKWDHGEELIQKMPFIVVQRGNEKAYRGTGWWRKPPHREIKFNWPISSTEIRDALRDGNWKFATRNLNPDVYDIIAANELYGCKENSSHGYGR